MRRPVLLASAAAVLLAGCGLPTPGGVRSAGEISQEQQADGVLVRPPGPLPGGTPTQIVTGFLAAQSYPEGDYAVAKSFLAPDAVWDRTPGVRVLDAGAAPLQPAAPESPEGRAELVMTRDVIGRVGQDGWAQPADGREERFTYGLTLVQGQWRLSAVPEGLTLTASERDRSLVAVPVMFLSTSPGPAHLVSDLVRVPNDDQLARRLVDQVLDGPSAGLTSRSGRTAVPPEVRTRSVQESSPGQVVVDLSGPVEALGEQARADLSAQLLWTLRLGLERVGRTLSSVQLLVDGVPLEVDGEDGPQGRDRWRALDPTGGEGAPTALAVERGGRVVSVPASGTPSAALDPGVVRVAETVADASSGRVAVLVNPAQGELRTLSVGLPPGPFTPVRRNERLQSPTWGDGAYGVWALRRGDDPAVLVGEPGRTREVEVEGGLRITASSVLRVSRDGARAALVDADQTLRLGRVERDGDALRIVDLRRVSDDDVDVRDVAWVDGTSVLALVIDDEDGGSDIPRPLLQIDVDGVGSERTSLNTAFDPFTRTLTAFGEAVLVAASYPEQPGSPQNVLAVFRRVNGVFPASGALPTGYLRPRFPD